MRRKFLESERTSLYNTVDVHSLTLLGLFPSYFFNIKHLTGKWKINMQHEQEYVDDPHRTV